MKSVYVVVVLNFELGMISHLEVQSTFARAKMAQKKLFEKFKAMEHDIQIYEKEVL